MPHSNLSQDAVYFGSHLMAKVSDLPKLVYIFRLLLLTGFLPASPSSRLCLLLQYHHLTVSSMLCVPSALANEQKHNVPAKLI